MNNLNWHFSNNTFETATKGSAKKLIILAADHLSKLKAESTKPEIADIVAETEVPVFDFTTYFAELKAASGVYKGTTLAFKRKIEELRGTKIKEWDIKIQNVHIDGTSDYTCILPKGRAPFQKGAYENRIANVYALFKQLEEYPSLSAIKTEVLAYHTLLVEMRDNQQRKEGLVNEMSAELKKAAKVLTNQMYKNTAKLMLIYFETPGQIERYFDLTLIRRKNTKKADMDDDVYGPFDGTVNAGKVTNVLDNNFTALSDINIENTGSVPLLFYLSNNPNADMQPPTIGIEIAPNTSQTHPVLEFGAAFVPYLNVKNLSNSLVGSFEVMII